MCECVGEDALWGCMCQYGVCSIPPLAISRRTESSQNDEDTRTAESSQIDGGNEDTRTAESSQNDGGNEDTRTAESSQNDGGNEDTRTAESSQNDGGNEDILSQKVHGELSVLCHFCLLRRSECEESSILFRSSSLSHALQRACEQNSC